KEFHIDRVCVARGDGHDQRLIEAVHRFLRPPVFDIKVSVHATNRIAGSGYWQSDNRVVRLRQLESGCGQETRPPTSRTRCLARARRLLNAKVERNQVST